MPSDADAGRGEQAACPWRAPADQATRARDSGHYNPPSGSLHTHFLIMLFGWDCQWASVKCLRTCVCVENFFCKMLNFA